MKRFYQLNPLFFYNEALMLPTAKDDNSQSSCVCYNMNTTLDSLSKLILGQHNVLMNISNSYRYYYYDALNLGRSLMFDNKIIPTNITNADSKKDRLERYKQIQNKVNGIRTPNNLQVIEKQSSRNLIYDLDPFVSLYSNSKKVKKLGIVKQMQIFFDLIQSVYQKDIGFKKCPILINLDDYKYFSSNTHILTNLFLLLNRGQKIIDKFQCYDFSILFYTNYGYFLFDMKTDISKSNKSVLKKLLKRLKFSSSVEKEVQKIENDAVISRVMQSSSKNFMRGGEMTSDEFLDEDLSDDYEGNFDNNYDDEQSKEISDVISTKFDKSDEKDDYVIQSEEDIFKTEEEKSIYLDILNNKNTGKTKASLERDEALRAKQKDIKVKTMTIEEITKQKSIPLLKDRYIQPVKTTNENLKHLSFSTFNSTYMEELYEKDIANCIISLNENKLIPMNVVDLRVEDTSDSFNMKETYTIVYEDVNRRRHTIKVSLPIFIENKFIYVNGSKKTIQKQNFGNPVIKTGPNEVQIITNYQKIFIRRVGSKFSKSITKLYKLLDESKYISVVRGCNTAVNQNMLTSLDYDELAKGYSEIIVNSPNNDEIAHFVFNTQQLKQMFPDDKNNLDQYICGYLEKKKGKNDYMPIWYKKNTQEYEDIVALILQYCSDEDLERYRAYTAGKKYVHTEATLLAKKVPVILLISFWEGLDTVIRKFSDRSVQFSDKKLDDLKYQNIKFSDGYLCYPLSNTEACILFNGLTTINTRLYTFSDMNNRSTYIDIFEYLLGTSYVANAFITYYEWMIDPITLNMLEILDYPTDIVSLVIFANNLIADNSYLSDIDPSMYRLRDNEVIAAILYKNLSKAYARYRSTANNNNPVKMSLKEDCVLKDLLELPNVEDYSELSPMVEVNKFGMVSMRGANGMNQERAYKLDKRAFHDNMTGIIGMATDSGPNCGKIKQLSVNPSVINARGMFKIIGREGSDKLTDANLSTPVELLTPLSNTSDSPERNNMCVKQTCHVIPVEHGAPVLVSSGMEEMIHYITSNDFSVVSKDDGKVLEFDKSTNIMIIEYKDKTRQAIDLGKRVVKNGGGGFYLTNQLVTSLKEGNTFKKDEVIAYDPKYYKDDKQFGNRLTYGTLCKVATMSGFFTYEDSNFITKNMSEQMASNITTRTKVILGANSNIDYIVSVGDQIIIGDELIRYETSYNESELNKLLSNIRQDVKEEIIDMGKNAIRSHYTGYIESIDVISTVDLEELSPSLQKLVKSYQSSIKSKKKLLDKYDSHEDAVYRMGMLLNKPYDKVIPDQYGKVAGNAIGKGVMIYFYITYHDELSDGDKLAAQTANKNTVGYVVPRGKEPYSEFRKYEEVSSIIAPSAIIQRGTPSVIKTSLVYKCLIELKRKLYEILTGENFDEILKQKQPWMVRDNKQDITETVQESNKMEDSNENLISIFENNFGLLRSEQDDYYVSSVYMPKGRVILTFPKEMDMSSMLHRFLSHDQYYNAVYDPNECIIIAIDDILEHSPIVVKYKD